MKALILTAGFGRRMRPLSLQTHKTLLEIAPGQTVLGRIIGQLLEADLEDIVIVTGYRSADIRDYVAEHFPELQVTFVHNERYAETNNIHSMALAFQSVSFDEGLVLVESDLIFDDTVLPALMASSAANAALIDRYRPGMDGTVVKVDDGGVLVDVIPGSRQGQNFDFSDTFKTLNIYRFSGEFCATTFGPLLRFYSGVIDDNCYYEYVVGMLIAIGHARISGVRVPPGSWAEVDDPVDLHHALYLSDPAHRRRQLDQAWGGYWGLEMMDFAFIRNMHYPTPQVLSELRLQLPDLLFNYGSSQEILDRKMAWFLEVDHERVVALNGAAQFFPWAARRWSGASAWVPEPTFGEWSRVFPHAAPYADDGSGVVGLPRGEDVADGGVVVIVNPNNPTGTTVPTLEILELAQSAPNETFLIDESFIHFSGQPSMVDLLEDTPLPNVVVLQSLSKALGVPGARIGFAYSRDNRILRDLRADLPIWNMNSVAEKFLELLLKNRETVADSFAATVVDREDLVGKLQDLAVVGRVAPSGANFVMVELNVDPTLAADIADRLLSAHEIYIKDVSPKFGDGVGRWRLAVRRPADHAALVAAVAGLTG